MRWRFGRKHEGIATGAEHESVAMGPHEEREPSLVLPVEMIESPLDRNKGPWRRIREWNRRRRERFVERRRVHEEHVREEQARVPEMGWWERMLMTDIDVDLGSWQENTQRAVIMATLGALLIAMPIILVTHLLSAPLATLFLLAKVVGAAVVAGALVDVFYTFSYQGPPEGFAPPVTSWLGRLAKRR